MQQVNTEYRTVTDMACDRLRVAIVEGMFEPGQQLKERELSKMIGVSTTPIKAALQRLALEGLVTSVPLRGSYVAESLSSTLSEVRLLRAAVEGTAAFLAALKVTDEDIARLGAQVDVMRSRTRDRDMQGTIKANSIFHDIIVEIGRNPMLGQMSGMMRHYADVSRPKVLASEDQMVQGFEEHRAVHEAIANRDPRGAERAMRNHVLKGSRFVELTEESRD